MLKKNLPLKQALLISVGGSALYLSLSALLVGFKPDQIALALACSFLMLCSGTTRKFIIGFFPFVIFWILFDWMKAFPNYLTHSVAIESIYNLEKQFFSIENLTPSEFFAHYHSTFLDVLTGFFYLSWVPVPILFSCVQFFKNRRIFLEFILVFLWVNLIGFVIYYLYPAAPPWYVQLHGFAFQPLTPGNPAGLIHFDHFFGIHLFQGMYAKSSNVFAAMPSLHSAYPVVLLFFSIKSKNPWFVSGFISVLMVGIWFSAVYLGHHYVLDVLAGITCAILAICSFHIALKKAWFSKWFNHYASKVLN